MSRVLLLMPTQTYRASAFLKAATSLGLEVVVGTEQEQVLAHLNPAGFLAVDFHDLEGATDKIVEYAQDNSLQAIIAAEDDGVLLAAMASDALALQHNTLLAVRSARNKYQTRKALAAAGMRTPEFQRFSITDDPGQIADKVSYPSVVKPLALSASRGVMRVNNVDEFVVAFRRLVDILDSINSYAADHDLQQILVESYLPGVEVALEGIIQEGELSVLAIFDKPDELEGPFFEETIYVTPSRLPKEMQTEITATTQEAIRALGLTTGPVHVEMRINEEGVWILEVAPRSIGGYCSIALRFGLGTTLEELILQQALGISLTSTLPATPASGVMMIPIPKAGVLCEINGVEQAKKVPGIDEIRMTIPVGQEVVTLPEGSQYLGFIYARDEAPEKVEAALRQAHKQLNFVIMPPDEM
ncbi:MAG: ATP-grasp domain-containing protein [Chloroflexi bacterium]|nr:ATP-grasp domain-containing protein [Chloroflexota bacterium]